MPIINGHCAKCGIYTASCAHGSKVITYIDKHGNKTVEIICPKCNSNVEIKRPGSFSKQGYGKVKK